MDKSLTPKQINEKTIGTSLSQCNEIETMSQEKFEEQLRIWIDYVVDKALKPHIKR